MCHQVDFEEAKAQEITNLQNTITELQEKLDESHVAIIREKEAAKLAIEQAPPVIKEVPVVDNTQLELLNSQNNELEVNFELDVPSANQQILFLIQYLQNVG